MNLRIVIQARMSSQRLPGKVLAPFRGRPMIDHIVAAASSAIGATNVTVITSSDHMDDPLAAYLQGRDVQVLRGPLDDVFARFALAASIHADTWLMRLCADSPLMDAALLKSAAAATMLFPNADIISNVYPHRTFPKGLSIEIVKRSLFIEWNCRPLTVEQREHVTKPFYDYADTLNIVTMESDTPDSSSLSYVVDTLEDYRRLNTSAEIVPDLKCQFSIVRARTL